MVMVQLVDRGLFEEIAALDRGAVMAEVLGMFLRDSRATMAAIGQTFDRTQLARHAHKLKGSSASLGFPALAHACDELECACDATPNLAPVVSRLRAIYAETVEAISAL